MPQIEISESDISTEILMPEQALSVSERVAWLADAPIRVVHTPTGLTAVGEGQGSQVGNKGRALELLKEELVKRKWNG